MLEFKPHHPHLNGHRIYCLERGKGGNVLPKYETSLLDRSNNDPKRTVQGSLKSDLMLPAHDADKICKDNI